MAAPKQTKSLWVFLGIGLIALIAVDPGLVNGWHSIRYDLAEGQNIAGRLIVLCVTSLIVLLPLLIKSRPFVTLYLAFVFVATAVGLSFRLINGQFSLWKVGTHFPYPKTYPDSTQYPNADKAEHYRHAIHWAVEGFLKRLLPGLESLGKPIVVMYTSDHGQGLGENGNHSTHCLPEHAPDVQARVPLVLMTLGVESTLPFLPQAGRPYSQFQIFPSLLRLMGYPPDGVQAEYGPDLSEPWQGERVYFSGDLWGRGQLSRNVFHYDAKSTDNP